MTRHAQLDMFEPIARRRCFGYERHLEPPAGHGEILHRFGDAMRELVGGKAPFGRERQRHRAIALLCVGDPPREHCFVCRLRERQ